MPRKTNNKSATVRQRIRRHARMTLVPHKANQFRPLLIRRYGLAAVLLLVVGLQISYNFAVTGSVLGRSSVLDTSELIAETNHEREQAGLQPLARSAALDTAATLKANDMFANNYWAHTSPSGVDPWQWFARAGYEYSAAGENLAKNFRTPAATTAAWMNSEEHRKNILSGEYSEVGISSVSGELNGEPVTLTVALYGRPAGVMAVAGEQAPQSSAPLTSNNPLTNLGVAMQSLSPAALASMVLLLLAASVALLAHAYRDKLPKFRRTSWYRHHGLVKVGIVAGVLVGTVLLQSGGQI